MLCASTTTKTALFRFPLWILLPIRHRRQRSQPPKCVVSPTGRRRRCAYSTPAGTRSLPSTSVCSTGSRVVSWSCLTCRSTDWVGSTTARLLTCTRCALSTCLITSSTTSTSARSRWRQKMNSPTRLLRLVTRQPVNNAKNSTTLVWHRAREDGLASRYYVYYARSNNAVAVFLYCIDYCLKTALLRFALWILLHRLISTTTSTSTTNNHPHLPLVSLLLIRWCFCLLLTFVFSCI